MITPAEKGEIVVEDVAFLAVEMTVTGQGKEQSLEFCTNVDDIVIAGEDNPLRIEEDLQTGEPSPYILVRDRLEARLNRPVFYELVDLGVEEVINNERIYGVWSNGQFFQIGKITEA